MYLAYGTTGALVGASRGQTEGASFSNLLVMTMLEKFRVTMIMEATKIVVYLQFVVETNI